MWKFVIAKVAHLIGTKLIFFLDKLLAWGRERNCSLVGQVILMLRLNFVVHFVFDKVISGGRPRSYWLIWLLRRPVFCQLLRILLRLFFQLELLIICRWTTLCGASNSCVWWRILWHCFLAFNLFPVNKVISMGKDLVDRINVRECDETETTWF